jgi:hypothetical protein
MAFLAFRMRRFPGDRRAALMVWRTSSQPLNSTGMAERDAGILLPPPASSLRRIVLVLDVAGDGYSLALLKARPVRRLGGLVTGAAAATAGAADARFVVEFQVGDQVKADPLAFLTQRARAVSG